MADSIHVKNSHSHSGSGVIFSGFPMHDEDYAGDVLVIMNETIEKYGVEEWKKIVLTCELHGHLGVYAIIGAKMGLYAREILNAGHDELVIQSFAGSMPPVSCFNDGLQVSTGATLGHGLISIKQITYKGKTMKISLKDSIQKEIESHIKDALSESGGLTEEYWQKVREIALRIWVEYDRGEIFLKDCKTIGQ